MALVLGIDSSTQSVKVEARDLDTGAVVATGSAAHPPTTPPVSEQDPQAWWQALVGATTAIGPHRADVVAMAVAAQQHGLVMLDDSGTAVRPAMLWNDTTSAPQADELTTTRSPQVWADACGSVPVAAFTVAKLARVAATEPAALDRVARIMLPHDYLTWRLTGRHVTDRGDASGTGWFDPATNTYQPDLLAAAVGADSGWLDRLPEVLGPTEVAGELTTEAADVLGLPAGIPIGPGTGDNMGAALGLGLRPGDLALSLGTSGTVYAVSTTATHDPSGAVAGFADATGRFLPLVCTLNATGVTDTVAAWLGTDAPGLSELALSADPGFGGVTLIPYFDGERTPNLPDATGLFAGLRRTTTRADLARAAHDGVVCGLLDGLDALRACGVAADGRLHLVGGGARSAAYRQRTADLWGAPIRVPDADEAVATGAAVQAAVVAGAAADASAVAERWNLGVGHDVEPAGTDGAEVRAAYGATRPSS
ncbi:MAG: xylulokinase [Actinomycetota bacterium]